MKQKTAKRNNIKKKAAPKIRIKKGDKVIVLSGKDRGKEGVVSKVFANGKVLVDGVNIVKRHQKPRQSQQTQSGVIPGGIIDKDMPLPVSRVAVISPDDGKPTRVGYRFDPQGKKIRICKRTKADLK